MPLKKNWRAVLRRWHQACQDRLHSGERKDWHAVDLAQHSQDFAYHDLQRSYPEVLNVMNLITAMQHRTQGLHDIFVEGSADNVLEETLRDLEVSIVQLRAALSKMPKDT